MKFRLKPFAQLAREELDAWSVLQQASSECDSPYFRPEYHALAASVGRPVMVAVMESGGQPVGFLPFEQGALGTAHPVGLRLSDFHGAIVQPGLEWRGVELLRRCGIRRFYFDHLPLSQTKQWGCHESTLRSSLVDLSGGFAAYRESLRQRGEKEFDRVVKKREKMVRELAPVRFELHDRSPDTFAACLRWKSAQYERTGALNVFAHDWVVELLRRIATHHSPHFQGTVSSLYMGDELIAVHVGMRTARVVHHWFPAHNPEHPAAKYSPGLQLVAGMLEHFAATGVERFDFGTGDYRYKRDFETGAIQVAQGVCGGNEAANSLDRTLKNARSLVRRTAEFAGFTTPVQWYRKMRNWLVMR